MDYDQKYKIAKNSIIIFNILVFANALLMALFSIFIVSNVILSIAGVVLSTPLILLSLIVLIGMAKVNEVDNV